MAVPISITLNKQGYDNMYQMFQLIQTFVELPQEPVHRLKSNVVISKLVVWNEILFLKLLKNVAQHCRTIK